MDGPSPQPPRPPSEARWIGEAVDSAREEVHLYARTAGALLRAPRRFGQLWGDGHLRVLNPLGFAATTLAAMAFLDLLHELLPGVTNGGGGGHSLLRELLEVGGTYLHLASLGVLSHFALKALRRRRRLLGSVGLALYAGGTAALAAVVLETLVFCAVPSVRNTQVLQIGAARPLHVVLLMVPLVLCLALFVWLLASALAGLHRVSRAATLGAVLLAFVGTGFFFGYVDPPGHYGLRLELKLRHEGKRWRLGGGLSLD